MLTWRQIIGGTGIAGVIILSSTQLVVFDPELTDPSSDFCTRTHEKDESSCRADTAHHCVWCISRAVAPMCYDEATAAQLPPAVFKCDLHATLGSDPADPPGAYCMMKHRGDEDSCKEDKDHDCVWCTSETFPAMCYDSDIASKLPPSVFKCNLDAYSATVETV